MSSQIIDNRETEHEPQAALVVANGSESAYLGFLDNTLVSLSENQKSILNSQAANRELMGVVVQDNFNLKDENSRLRERILELERSMAQLSRHEQDKREALRQEFDNKIMAIQQLATEAMIAAKSVQAPEIKAVNTKPGCLGALFGGGGTQIITSFPRSPKHETAAESAAKATATMPSAAGHPKPIFPPE